MPNKKSSRSRRAPSVKSKSSKLVVSRPSKSVVAPAKTKGYVAPIPVEVVDPPALPIKRRELSEQDISSFGLNFGLSEVINPLVGTPAEVRKELDALALHLKRNPTDSDGFARIELYMRKYLMGIVYRRFPYVVGADENDVYQEALIAIHRKAIPKFNPKARGKGGKTMSFLNYAKLCIDGHLITMLHSSRHKKADAALNTAVSLDHGPAGTSDEDAENCALSNVITDDKHSAAPYRDWDNREAFERTLLMLKAKLSDLEVMILEEWLRDNSYKDIAEKVRAKGVSTCNSKCCDNSLSRLRKKALALLKEVGKDELPLLLLDS